jgi:DNA-binding NtrC family response regulator
VVLGTGAEIGLDFLPPELRGVPANRPAGGNEVITLREAERRAIVRALESTGWKKGETAEILGISWPTLNKKIEDYGIKKAGE